MLFTLDQNSLLLEYNRSQSENWVEDYVHS